MVNPTASTATSIPTTAATVAIDALPYVDKEYTSEMQSLVSQLVREEMKRSPSAGNSVEYKELMSNRFPPANDLLRKSRTSLINVLSDEVPAVPSQAIDMDRYNVTITNELLESSDPLVWREMVNRLKSKLEYERDSLLNLELLQKFGGNAWKLHNYHLEMQSETLDGLIDQTKDEMQQLNKRRKVEQLKAGKELTRLELQWQELVESKRQVQRENERLIRRK